VKRLIYICDNKRHLICLPYSIENLHKMANDLNIGRHFFHKKDKLSHYDIPAKRIKEITSKCDLVVGWKDIVIIINKNL